MSKRGCVPVRRENKNQDAYSMKWRNGLIDAYGVGDGGGFWQLHDWAAVERGSCKSTQSCVVSLLVKKDSVLVHTCIVLLLKKIY